VPADRIELRGLRVLGIHGLLPEEQVRPQPFEVDIDLVVNLSLAGSSDNVSDTVDYASVADAVRVIVEREHYGLMEALASRLADALLGLGPVEEVEVGLRKLRPPVAADLASAGVRIRRPRPR
jgi:dihydroneopterin aldolase